MREQVFRVEYLVGWPSGLRRTLGKRVCESTRRFESCPHRNRTRPIHITPSNMKIVATEPTVFWAKVIGFFMVIATASQLVRRNKFAEIDTNKDSWVLSTAVLVVLLLFNLWVLYLAFTA
jgi:hypothetical protein